MAQQVVGRSCGSGHGNPWQVDLAGKMLTEPAEVDVEGYPAIETQSGLAIETHDGIRL
jgi:hypothetical protein